jgi:2-polyprenyl-3-methyl-5-hydroxy-6-metoxy-1,4-benzoquinol methylase
MQNESIQTLLVEKTLDHARFLIACAEPVKAHALLKELAPVSVLHHPRVVAMRESLEKQIDQWFSDEAYVRRYTVYDNGGVPNEPFSDTNLRNLFRAQFTLATAKQLQPKRYLSVGGGEGTVPLTVMEACPKTEVTLSELLGVGGNVAKALEARFPGRVKVTGRFDTDRAPIEEEEGFDFIECLEVVEHVSDDEGFLFNLFWAANEGATLCLSTPNSTDWIESKLVTDFGDKNWYHHVRAYDPRALATVLLRAGWLPTIFYADKCLHVIATRHNRNEQDPFQEEVAWSLVGQTEAVGKVCPANVTAKVAGREVIVVCLNGTLLAP